MKQPQAETASLALTQCGSTGGYVLNYLLAKCSDVHVVQHLKFIKRCPLIDEPMRERKDLFQMTLKDRLNAKCLTTIHLAL